MATSKKSLEKQIADYEAIISKEGIPADERKFAEKELTRLQSLLKEATDEPAPEPDPTKKGKKKASAKPAAQDKPKKAKPNKNLEKLTIEIEGKKVKLSEADCWQVVNKVAERLEKSKAAGKKYKTKPVTEKAGDSLETAAGHIEDAVTKDRIEDDPKAVLAGAKLMEEGYEKLFEGFEKMTGKKIPAETKKQIMEIIDGIKEEAKEAQE